MFAFWYGYKKYERDKEIELIHLVKDLNNEEDIKNTIINWSIGYKLNTEGKLDDIYFRKIESHSELQFINAIISSNSTGITLIIAELLMYFDKNIYIQNKLKEFKTHWENPEYQNSNTIEFNKIISIFESNGYKK